MASSSGVTVLVVLGLLALGAGASDGDGSSSSAADAPAGADDDFSFEPDPGQAGDGDADADSDDGTSDDTESCDDVVIDQSDAGDVEVPGDAAVFSESTVDCDVGEGSDDEAVAALQDALVRCNGQDVAVDGDYGPATAEAVANVQREGGVPADGTYDAETREAMQWPATSSSGEVTCVSDVDESP